MAPITSRMGRKSPDYVSHTHRMFAIEPSHQRLLTADQSDRHPARDRLPVDDHVGPDAEILLRAARSQAKAGEYFVEDQWDCALSTDLAQLLQPLRVAEKSSLEFCVLHW